MPRITAGRLAAAAGVVLAVVVPASAIEMFTYFGDGSRIGLPSLEVPIQAYPGIPLRADRRRARTQAMRRGGPAVAGTPRDAVAPPGMPGGGITIRPMTPEESGAMPAPVPGRVAPQRPAIPRVERPRAAPPQTAPMPPEPVPAPAEPILPGLSRPVFPPQW